MLLKDIVADISVNEVVGTLEKEIADIEFDSRKVKAASLFVAVKGTQVDGHQFIDMAIVKGATAILCEEIPHKQDEAVTYLRIEESQSVLALAMSAFYGHPARSMKIIGITGTNGKSSTTSLLHALFNQLGFQSGLLSTIHYKIGDKSFHASHTTPDAKQIQQLFAQMREADCEYCFMEVSSHALMQARTAGISFSLALFTNITHDHLDYHGTFAEYIKAKKRLFDQLDQDAIALINTDDRNGRVMVQNCKAKVKSYAMQRMADYRGKLLENTFEGLRLEIDGLEAWFRLLGSFNAYNILSVYAIARELGLAQEEILTFLSKLEGIPGRFEVIRSNQKQLRAIVDYAHTPDALQNVLSTISDINQGAQQVIVVVGCGGDRDKTKRPLMGKIAAEYGNQVILTSDNPRNEQADTIIEEMYEGIPLQLRRKVLRIENRRAAIETACQLTKDKDIILVAGKGHEDYQEIQGVKHPFDDRLILRETFEKYEI